MAALILIIIALAAFAVSWAVTNALVTVLRKHMMDQPTSRSSHIVPTPRGGGLGIIAGLAAGLVAACFLSAPVPPWRLLAGTALMAAVGFADDRVRGLPATVRLLLQFAAAALVVVPAERFSLFPLPPPLDFSVGPFALPLALLWVVGVTNVYNFLDGIDGYAATQGLIGGAAIALADLSGPLAPAALALAGACAGFLIHNWHPAKVFMGDVGAAALGFFFAAVPFHLPGARQSDMILLVALALWFFLTDGIYTFIRRLIRGEKVWQAHRSHLYQRLVISGLRHDQVVIRIALASAFLAGGAALGIAHRCAGGMWGILLCATLLFVTLLLWTLRRERSLRNAA